MNINLISIILNQIENTPTVQNNLPLKNAIEKYRNGDTKGLEQLARNLCKENGINADDMLNQMKNKFGM